MESKMNVVYKKIEELRAAEYNPRQMTKHEADTLTRSMREYGFAEPIVINTYPGRELVIVGGHQRVNIAKIIGIEDIPCVEVSLPLEREQKLNLLLNKALGSWDWNLLANFDRKMLIETGFTNEELSAKLVPPVSEDGFDAEKAREEALKNLYVKRSDIYQLGRHRLMCGDSTDANDVAKLMGNEKADMIFTDPPYNVNYSYVKYEAIHKSRKKKFIDRGKIFNDNKDEWHFYQFLLDVFSLGNKYSHDYAPMYICHAMKTQMAFLTAYRDAGYLFSQTIIWLKERIILAMGQDYHRVYEPIIFGWKKGSKHFANRQLTTTKEVWDLDRKTFEERLDVWYIARDKSSDYIHPTQKPIRLIERAMKKSSKIGDLLYEPFSGSGSTLMACEQSERRCNAIDLDPAYVQASIQRWETATGEKAKKL